MLNPFKLIALAVLPLCSIAATELDSDPITRDADNEHTQKADNRLVISASRDPFLSQAPESVAAINLAVKDVANQPVSVLSLVEQAPGVSANGQGGLFQTWSIRGVAKHRIKTLVEGVPIITERRAGISASFIDPTMIESVDIISGPVSTFYGSGALGGAMNLYLPRESSSAIKAGLQSQGDGQYLSALWADEYTQFGASYRDIGQSKAANGQLLNDAYRLSNVYARHRWQQEHIEYQLLWLAAAANDIGKSNLRYPDDRITIYPEENHQLVKFNVKSDEGWLAYFYYHPNDLIAETERVGSRMTTSFNESEDFGGSWQSQFWQQDNGQAQWGIDWLSRRDVSAREVDRDFASNTSSESIIMANAELDDVAVFLSGYWSLEAVNLHLGARYNRQSQQATGSDSITDTAYSGFAGFEIPLNDEWQLTLNLASGFRFPTLSERFFTGTTPRGEVVSVADLDTERSLNLDTALRFQTGIHDWSLRYFKMQVQNYIERITLNNGNRSYINLDEGHIWGNETLYRTQWDAHTLSASYTQYHGKDKQGVSLADIPARKLAINYLWQSGQWSWQLGWARQLAKHRVGDGELQRPSYQLVSSKVRYQFNEQWQLTVFVNNALDELYIPSSDDLDTYAAGRNIGLAVQWQAY